MRNYHVVWKSQKLSFGSEIRLKEVINQKFIDEKQDIMVVMLIGLRLPSGVRYGKMSGS
tara:strand:+ start:311 stop:487 length:177 start_codon:yes stop_codon:yes gene_type:complete